VERSFRLLAIDTLDEAANAAGSDSRAFEDVREFLRHLSAAGLREAVRFDLSVIRGLSYYTGIVFEGFDSGGAMRAVFGGGRYDDLLGTVGGRPATGVGLGFGDVVIADILTERGLTSEKVATAAIAVGYMSMSEQEQAERLAAELRRAGERVDLSLSPERAKSFFSRAARSGSVAAVYLGPDDVAKGAYRIKDMHTREEREGRLPG
jgi:histidyl-tRNA synthetase